MEQIVHETKLFFDFYKSLLSNMLCPKCCLLTLRWDFGLHGSTLEPTSGIHPKTTTLHHDSMLSFLVHEDEHLENSHKSDMRIQAAEILFGEIT